MYRYFVICGDKRVYSTDCARAAHAQARWHSNETSPAYVVRVVCNWQMTATRFNA